MRIELVWCALYWFGLLLRKGFVYLHVCVCPHLFSIVLRCVVVLLTVTYAGTTETNIMLMMFKGHTSLGKQSAESLHRRQSLALKRGMLSHQMPEKAILCRFAGIKGNSGPETITKKKKNEEHSLSCTWDSLGRIHSLHIWLVLPTLL